LKGVKLGYFLGVVGGEAGLRHCEHLIVGPMFELKIVIIGRNPPVWLLYIAYEAVAYETKCIFRAIKFYSVMLDS
jgi:hypothetical protein